MDIQEAENLLIKNPKLFINHPEITPEIIFKLIDVENPKFKKVKEKYKYNEEDIKIMTFPILDAMVITTGIIDSYFESKKGQEINSNLVFELSLSSKTSLNIIRNLWEDYDYSLIVMNPNCPSDLILEIISSYIKETPTTDLEVNDIIKFGLSHKNFPKEYISVIQYLVNNPESKARYEKEIEIIGDFSKFNPFNQVIIEILTMHPDCPEDIILGFYKNLEIEALVCPNCPRYIFDNAITELKFIENHSKYRATVKHILKSRYCTEIDIINFWNKRNEFEPDNGKNLDPFYDSVIINYLVDLIKSPLSNTEILIEALEYFPLFNNNQMDLIFENETITLPLLILYLSQSVNKDFILSNSNSNKELWKLSGLLN